MNKDLVALLSGALLVFAFAPFDYFYLAIPALVGLVWTWLDASTSRAAWRGWLFGIGLFGGGISWVFISIHVYGNTSALIAALITSGFVLLMASFIALHGYVWRGWFSYNDPNSLLLAFPLTWVLIECLRTYLFTGCPWLLLGYSQAPSFLGHFALIGSVYLVSFIVALNAGLIIYALLNRHRAIYSISGLLVLWGLGGLLASINWTTTQGALRPASCTDSKQPITS